MNAQLRLKALHHLDVPWLPSDIEQREGRIERQGNQNDEVDIYAYATLGSMDATMWQNNERKARFIAAALSGDRTIRTIDDIGEAANQFALAKAIASGDARLMQKAGLEGEIARLDRQRAAHFDDQLAVRRQISNADFDLQAARRRVEQIGEDLKMPDIHAGRELRLPVAGSAHRGAPDSGRAATFEGASRPAREDHNRVRPREHRRLQGDVQRRADLAARA